MIHQLKTMPEYFNDVITGKKTFEFRVNDRNYKVGDYLALNEYDPNTKTYTGRSCLVIVDYILDEHTAEGVPALKNNLVIMSIKPTRLTLYGESPEILIGTERKDMEQAV